MKKFLKYVAILVLFAVPFLAWAAEFRAGEQPSVGSNEKISNDLYMGGGSVVSAGSVLGDLITAGGNVVISGDVGADLLVGGGNVTILSNVGDDLRAGGGTVVLSGKVGGDLLLGGGQVTVSGAGVGGDAVIGAGVLRLDAPVAGDLTIGGGNVYLNSTVGGNVKIEADKVTLGSKAVISGNLTYKAKTELVKEEGAIVKGKVDFEQRVTKNISAKSLKVIFSGIFAVKMFALLVCALILGRLFRRWSRELVNTATERPWFEVARGVLVFVAAPAISMLFFVTVVGFPFGIAGLLGFGILMLFAWIATPIVLGSVVYRYFSKREIEISWKTTLLGVVLYAVLWLIPFVGWLAQALLMFLTLGSLVALKLKIAKEWR